MSFKTGVSNFGRWVRISRVGFLKSDYVEGFLELSKDVQSFYIEFARNGGLITLPTTEMANKLGPTLRELARASLVWKADQGVYSNFPVYTINYKAFEIKGQNQKGKNENDN